MLRRSLGRSRLRVVPHGLDPSLAARARRVPPRAELARRLGLRDAPYVLGVGRLRAKKAWDVLLEALALQAPGAPRQLVLAGPDGDAADALRARAAELPTPVHVLGFVEDATLAALYVHAAVLAHPAPLEGFGLTPLEALACGTPVVVSSAGRVPEGVGEAALVVEGHEPRDWAEALARAVADDAAAAARARAAEALIAERTAEAAAAGLLAVWRELVPAGRAP